MEGEPTGLVQSDEPFEEQTAEQRPENPRRQEEGGTRGDPS